MKPRSWFFTKWYLSPLQIYELYLQTQSFMPSEACKNRRWAA